MRERHPRRGGFGVWTRLFDVDGIDQLQNVSPIEGRGDRSNQKEQNHDRERHCCDFR